MTGIQPFLKDVEMCGRITRSNASQDESQLARFVFYGLGEFAFI